MCRVSSAAMSGTARRTSSARIVMSPRLPIGRRHHVQDATRRVAPSPTPSSVIRPGPIPAGGAGRGSRPRPSAARASRSGGTCRLNSEPAIIRSTRSTVAASNPSSAISSDGAALVDPPEEQPIEDRVAEPALGLVGLAGPQVGRRCLADDRIGHAQGDRQLPDLALVQVADRIERAGRVAEQRRVADERLGLVAGPDDEPAERHRPVVQHRHPHPRGEVAASQRRSHRRHRTRRATSK